MSFPGYRGIEGAGSPELSAAMRLLDDAKSGGFTFERIARDPTARCEGCGKPPGESMRSTWPGSGSRIRAAQSAGAAHL
jgi:hypothetical protein